MPCFFFRLKAAVGFEDGSRGLGLAEVHAESHLPWDANILDVGFAGLLIIEQGFTDGADSQQKSVNHLEDRTVIFELFVHLLHNPQMSQGICMQQSVVI